MGASAEPATFVAILGAASTLAATLLGGGGAIVPMEDPIRESGYVLSPFLFLLGAAWTLYTSFLLLRVSAISGEASYEDIAEKTLGKIGSYTVQSFIVLNAFLICVSLQAGARSRAAWQPCSVLRNSPSVVAAEFGLICRLLSCG